MAAYKRNVLFDAKNLSLSLLCKRWSLCVNLIQKQWQTTHSLSRSEVNLSEYSDTPEYPECFDTSREAKLRRRRQVLYDEIRDAPTVEEKYILLVPNNETYKPKPPYKYARSGMVRPYMPVIRPESMFNHYNTLPLIKFITRTHFVEKMPTYYENHIDSNLVDVIVEHITPLVESVIKAAFVNYKLFSSPASNSFYLKVDKALGETVIDGIHRIMSSLLHKDFSHLEQCQMDYQPRCDSFWYAGGFPPNFQEKRRRKKTNVDREAPMNLLTQFNGYPHLLIRNDDPLQPFTDVNDDLCIAKEENRIFDCAPSCYGIARSWRYPSSVPGVFYHDPCGFGTLSYYTREKFIKTAELFGKDSVKNALHGYGIANSFGWLNGLAYNKGFTSFHEITYPITTQTVITNGQVWSFYSYQLNTISFSTDFPQNKFRNVCWGTKELKLFDSVIDNEVKGLNPNVLQILARFYLNSPKKLAGINMTPYLREAKHPDEIWKFIDWRYRKRNANVPVSNRNLEKTMFEKIYKQWFNTRIDKLQ